MSKVRFKRLPKSQSIHHSASVKVTQMNHIVEVVHVAHLSNNLELYTKLNKDTYAVVDRDTGEVEIMEYSLNENRGQNTAGLKKTLKNISALINNNFTGASDELFITLTYRLTDGKPMNDVKQASKDFDNFIKRLRRKHKGIEYIAVLESQANTAWHWHLLVKFTHWKERQQFFIDNNTVIEPLWGHGWTKTKAIDNIDNIGAYLSAYLTDVEINDENSDVLFDTVYKSNNTIVIEEKEIADERGNIVTKKFIKGGRMHLYPTGTNIYRCSRGIKKPTPLKMTYAEAKAKIIGDEKPSFSQTTVIIGKDGDSDEERIYNSITYEQYNLKRKKR